MSNFYDTHTFLASDDRQDFAVNSMDPSILSLVLAVNRVGETIKLESFPNTVNSPLSNSPHPSLPSPHTPADDPASLSVALQGDSIFGSENTGVDLRDGYPLPLQGSNITLEEFAHLAKTVPAGYLLDLMALDPVPSVRPGKQSTGKLNHDPTLAKLEELEEEISAFPATQLFPRQVSCQAHHTSLPRVPLTLWQSLAYPHGSNLMAHHGIVLGNGRLNGGALNESMDGQGCTSGQDVLCGVPARTSSCNRLVLNKLSDGVLLKPIHTIPLLSPALAPSKPINSHASPTHLKRQHDGLSDTSNASLRPKRAKATVGSDSNKSGSDASGSAIANSVVTPPRGAAQGRPAAFNTPAIGDSAHGKIVSLPVPDSLAVPTVPDRQWRESLFGIGSLYFTLAPSNKCAKVAVPNTAVKKYACLYACPHSGMICWRLNSKQDQEWLKAISGHKNKSFFARHEAEWLRHLAHHRWEEWALTRCRLHKDGTTWDHARIDAQLVMDIKHPDTQPWCPDEIQTKASKGDMIKWLQASPLSNEYN